MGRQARIQENTMSNRLTVAGLRFLMWRVLMVEIGLHEPELSLGSRWGNASCPPTVKASSTKMKQAFGLLLVTLLLAGCNRDKPPMTGTIQPSAVNGQASSAASLIEARRGFKTRLVSRPSKKEPAADPPAEIFRTVHYESPVGKLAAYLTPDPKDGKKHPAIIWITGGDCNSIDDGCWTEGPPENDQSASAFRKAGIVMMFPSLRGGNDNPGAKESFLGEVDDILATADFLGKQPFVDQKRIYLGGHSTGGTLVLLTSECSDRFRAVFSFGPAHDVSGYGPEFLPFDLSNPKEIELRSPGPWLASIKSPTFVFEGTVQGNILSLRAMARASSNKNVSFISVRGATHFSTLAPTTRLIASKILRDTNAACNLSFTDDEVSKPFTK
jgi:acetyl esterase/lipase